MVSSKNINNILPKVGFDFFDYVEPVNHSGGIAVLWNNNDCYASILYKENRMIHLLVDDTSNKSEVIISGVYAPAQAKDKDTFWNHLCD